MTRREKYECKRDLIINITININKDKLIITILYTAGNFGHIFFAFSLFSVVVAKNTVFKLQNFIFFVESVRTAQELSHCKQFMSLTFRFGKIKVLG